MNFNQKVFSVIIFCLLSLLDIKSENDKETKAMIGGFK